MKCILTSLATIAVIACGALLAPLSAGALELPDGDEVVAQAWQNDQHMVLLVRNSDGYALRWLDLATGDVAVIKAPISFTKLRSDRPGAQQPEISLAQSGTALAVLEKYDSPLQPPDLSVYRISKESLEQVRTTSIPEDFWPAHLAWSTDGESLFMAVQRFLFPDQPYSIGRLQLADERFSGLALKANIDLITQLEYIPQRHALIGSCGGFRGEYPEQPMIALIQLNGSTQLLHSQAVDHWVNVLGDGTVLIGVDSSSIDSELWLLAQNGAQLMPAQCAFPDSAQQLAANSSGSWMGFIIPSDQLDLPAGEGGSFLVLQRTNDGKTVVTAESCSAFSFAPAGMQICALNKGGTEVQFYSLPD